MIRLIYIDDAARANGDNTPLAEPFRNAIKEILGEKNWSVGHSTKFRLFGTNVKETQESRHKDAQSLDKYVKDDEYVTLFVVSGGNTNWLMQGFDWNTRFRDILTMAVREGKAGYISYSAGTIAAGLDADLNVDAYGAEARNTHGQSPSKACAGLNLFSDHEIRSFRPHANPRDKEQRFRLWDSYGLKRQRTGIPRGQACRTAFLEDGDVFYWIRRENGQEEKLSEFQLQKMARLRDNFLNANN